MSKLEEITKYVRDNVAMLKAETKSKLTEEQTNVVHRFGKSMAVFASPGTGKTTTAVSGLLAANTVFGIKGKNINAMSFTIAASAELAGRYQNMCKQISIQSTIKFSTFHSLCYSIIRRVFPEFDVRVLNFKTELEDLQKFVISVGIESAEDMYYIKEIYNTIATLNSRLLFSEESVESSASYINLANKGMTIDKFNLLRSRWFRRNYSVKSITRGDIPLMTVFILHLHPEIAIDLKNEIDLMVIDESQDLSLLYLNIAHSICKELIIIGDLKQQIFGFNGASMLILDAYRELYPDAPVLELTQSFRCKDEIVELANSVIAPNKIEGYINFKGVGSNGHVSIVENSNSVYDDILSYLSLKQKNKEYMDVMFLARNNASIIPIIEKLYRNNIIFRSSKFKKIDELPIFKDLFYMAEIALNPTDRKVVAGINRIFPEFKWVKAKDNPILEVMRVSPRASDKNLLTVDFQFQESSYVILNKLRRFVELNNKNLPFGISCIPLFEIYEEFILEGKWWKLDQTKEYYFNLVESIICDKEYSVIKFDEKEKERISNYYESMNEGVRCYTFHSAKGLEADKVILIDVDNDKCPKSKTVKHLVDQGCLLDAAAEVRTERNLLYVAITRAKSSVTIIHNGDLSVLIDSPEDNIYSFLDAYWDDNSVLINEDDEFRKLMGVSNVNR